ncbi:phage minor capsid protein [uncultured Ruminococcus sp.]|uniref:phage minor capsid protein n=1 Tax=uncultured Ruminococcus sp. TaxID=165186 RepID=UPI00265CA8BC|nr:phage minor capsid protein [uncultured Ruminococcus sp.]
MFTPEVTEAIPIALEQIFDSLQMSIMTEIVRMLLEAAEIIPSTGYKMSRLYDLGTSKKRIKDIVARTLNLSNKEVENIFTNITESGYNEAENAFTEQGKEFIPYSENEPLQQFVRAVQEQTQDECKNITQSMGFAKRQPDGSLVFTPVADYYQETLDKAVTEIASGASDYNTVLEKTVTEMTNSGLRTVDYASGHSNRVTVAARRAVSTGLNQVVGKINEENAEKLGTNYFEVSWHSGARPSHQVWQGRVYSKEELESVCGLGTVTGLCGANCYHSYSPFTPGITPRTYTDEQLDKMNAEENKPVEYNGKTYTKYEATQRQRRLETTMRAQRQKIKLLEEGGADEQAIINARARYVKTSDEYVNFSKSVGLSQQWDRVTVGSNTVKGITKPKKAEMPLRGIKNVDDGKIRGMNSNKHIANSSKGDILKEESKKSITPITDKAIERVPKVDIDGYSEEQRVEIQKQHKELLKFSKEQNDNKEVAFVFRDGLVDYKPFTGSDEKIDFGTYLETKGKNLTILHNHPRNSSYSMNDLDVFANKNVRTITIVKNNGTVEYLTKTDDFDNNRFALECNRLYKKIVVKETDEEKDRFVKTLLNKSKAGVIWSGRK